MVRNELHYLQIFVSDQLGVNCSNFEFAIVGLRCLCDLNMGQIIGIYTFLHDVMLFIVLYFLAVEVQ